MAKNKPGTEEVMDDEMSESQRLSLLEKAMSLNRVFLGLLALLLIVSLSVTITLTILTALEDDAPPEVVTADLDALKQQLSAIEQDIEAQRRIVARLENELPETRKLLENSTAAAFQELLLEQENSIQAFLRGLREGMYDLSRMVTGSRTWLEEYNERMDQALDESLERKRELQRINTGRTLIEPDAGEG